MATPQSQEPQMPSGAKALIEAYPDFVMGYEADSLLLADGTRMLYDDGREKSFEEKLDDADPELPEGPHPAVDVLLELVLKLPAVLSLQDDLAELEQKMFVHGYTPNGSQD